MIGNLGQDPEIKTLESGKVARFTLATNESYKNSEGQKVEETTWHNIVAWNGLADTASRFLKKGREVAVEGKLVYRSYEDKKGVTKYITEIVLNDLLLLRSGKVLPKMNNRKTALNFLSLKRLQHEAASFLLSQYLFFREIPSSLHCSKIHFHYLLSFPSKELTDPIFKTFIRYIYKR